MYLLKIHYSERKVSGKLSSITKTSSNEKFSLKFTYKQQTQYKSNEIFYIMIYEDSHAKQLFL